ncbi:MAG: DUF6250 domain-containing protein [Nannocystaceae bacterium]
MRLALAPLALLLAPLALACEEVPRKYSTIGDAAVPIFADDFEAGALSAAWRTTGEGATIQGGALVVEGLKNHPVWLTTPLPDDVRIEFDATAATEEGDIKVEIAGDGRSAARSMNYVATGYVLIFGGWNNETNAIVRRNEHGRERQVNDAPHVEPGRRYHFTIVRQQGTIRWELDGQELLSYEDPTPLVGEGHQYFAFSGWESRVTFDNLVISTL